jgi:hypothetical protein
MLAQPEVGDVYRQEFLAGHAEDYAEVIAVNVSASVPAGTFHHCIQTRERSTIDPTIDEVKTYCPHVGVVLEVSGNIREELIAFSGL